MCGKIRTSEPKHKLASNYGSKKPQKNMVWSKFTFTVRLRHRPWNFWPHSSSEVECPLLLCKLFNQIQRVSLRLSTMLGGKVFFILYNWQSMFQKITYSQIDYGILQLTIIFSHKYVLSISQGDSFLCSLQHSFWYSLIHKSIF